MRRLSIKAIEAVFVRLGEHDDHRWDGESEKFYIKSHAQLQVKLQLLEENDHENSWKAECHAAPVRQKEHLMLVEFESLT